MKLVAFTRWIIQKVPSPHIIDQKLFLQREAVRMNLGEQVTPFLVAGWFRRLELLPVDVFLDEVLFEGKHRENMILDVRFWIKADDAEAQSYWWVRKELIQYPASRIQHLLGSVNPQNQPFQVAALGMKNIHGVVGALRELVQDACLATYLHAGRDDGIIE